MIKKQVTMFLFATALLVTSCNMGATPAPTVDVNAINTAAFSTAMAQLSAGQTQTALTAPSAIPTVTPLSLVTFPAAGNGSPAPGANPAGRGGGRGGNPAYTAARNAAIAKAVAGITAPSHGVTVDQLYVVITNPNHPLAAGLSGRVQAYRVPREMNWGAHLAPGAQVVATLAPSLEAAGDAAANTATDYSGAAVIYYVPKGGALAEGATAAGLRIQYFVENENGPGTYNLLTPEGFRLFDAAVNWALTQK